MRFEMIMRRLGAKITKKYDGFVQLLELFPKWHKQDWPLIVVDSSDSVAIFIADDEGLLTILQPRVAMTTPHNPNAIFEEAPAGRFDKAIDAINLAVAEVREEVGLTINHGDVKPINGGVPLALNPGVFTERMYLYVVRLKGCVLRERVGHKGGVESEGEQIVSSFVSFEDVLSGKHRFEDMKLFALFWWYVANILQK